MHNPYEDILPPEKVKIGRTAAWILSVLFLLAIVLPPLLLSNVSTASAKDGSGWVPVVEFAKAVRPAAATDMGIAQRLREFETKLEQNAGFARDLRRGTQNQLTGIFREGNNRTMIGSDGWLYFRPALQSLTGYGPITPEPSSVAKDPSRSVWKPALSAITRFAGQLRERGIDLVLVPAPIMPMIYPEHLTGNAAPTAPVRHRDSDTFFHSIRSAGITVIDVADKLWQMKETDAAEGAVFLKQDTHWRPRGMLAAAEAVAEYLKAQPWAQTLPPTPVEFATESVTASHIGDLVEKLDLPGGSGMFVEEQVSLTRVIDAATGEAITSDPTSPVVVLGDSFVNIFHDPSLGFAIEGDRMNGAGFAQQLAMKLERAVDVIAINGEASSGVREQFARRYDDEVRAKKAVVWVIAARDLFLSETPGKGLVRWDDVTFNSSPRPAQPGGGDGAGANDQAFTVSGTITMKSAIPNPQDSSYKDALYVIELEAAEIVRGKMPSNINAGDTLYIRLWAFKNRTFSKTSNVQEGEKVTLQLIPWDSKPELHTTRIEDDTLLFDPVPWWFGELAE
ncbi:MAG: hypothetical protein O3C21_15825 [Verrucomicrobia bacterium]|nr:hypothetical protein [Verrucomicrobiota bacterium]